MAAQEAPAVDPPGRQLLLIVLSVVFMFITAVGVSFRLYTRVSVSKKLFKEDVLILAGTIFAFGMSTCYTIGAFHGYGQQYSQIITHPGNLDLLYKLSFVVTYLYTAANYLVKMSFLALYHRLDSRRPMRLAVYALIAIESAQAIACFVITSLSWAPLSDMLKGDMPIISPLEIQDFYNVNGIVTAVTSAAIYITPLLMVHALDIPKRQKWAVLALFSLGFLSTAATCLKTYYSWSIVTSPDLYSRITTACLWIQVEVHAAIICGSAQTFRVLLKGFCPTCYRNSDEESYDHSHTIPEFPRPPHYSPSVTSIGSLPSPGLDPSRSGWKEWHVSTHDVSRTPTPSSSSTPRMVEFRTTDSASVPQGVWPSIASRIDREQELPVWEAEMGIRQAVKRASTPPWPLVE